MSPDPLPPRVAVTSDGVESPLATVGLSDGGEAGRLTRCEAAGVRSGLAFTGLGVDPGGVRERLSGVLTLSLPETWNPRIGGTGLHAMTPTA